VTPKQLWEESEDVPQGMRAHVLHAPQAQRAGEALVRRTHQLNLGHLKQNSQNTAYRLLNQRTDLLPIPYFVQHCLIWPILPHQDSTHNKNRAYRDAQNKRLYTNL